VIAADRAARKAWLEARGYRVCLLNAADVERDVAGQLDRLAGV
jgi:tRNA/rRNA methyltransferase